MGLLGKTLNDRTTIKKDQTQTNPVFQFLTQQQLQNQDKINKKKFNHLKSVMEQEKILTKVNRQKLLEVWIEMMKQVKANKLLQQITLQNQLFDRYK